MAREMDLRNEYPFEFTRKWFRNRNLGTFRDKLHPDWAGKPITYLEVGVFEGMSMVWMLQHVLTHASSRGIGVDPWLMTTKLGEFDMEDVKNRAFHNCGFYRNCVLQRGNSAEVLRRMLKRKGYLGIREGTLDLCMIDGDHNALAVIDDMQLVYRLLKVGGQMILDDVENDKPKADHVAHGRTQFLENNPGLELAWKHKYVETYTKVK